MLSTRTIKWYIDQSVPDEDARRTDPDCSPILASYDVLSKAPPTYVCNTVLGLEQGAPGVLVLYIAATVRWSALCAGMSCWRTETLCETMAARIIPL